MCRPGTSARPAGRCWTYWTGPGCGAWRRARWPRCSPSCTSTCASFAPSRPATTKAIRVFLGLLADDAGYRIDWAAVPPAALTAACDTGDPDPLRAVLQVAVDHIDPTRTGGGRKRREVH